MSIASLRAITFAHLALLQALLFWPGAAAAEGNTLVGRDLAVRSNGNAEGNAWVLDGNGYVGTYLRVDEPAEISITVRTAGQTDGDVTPQLSAVVADHARSFAATDKPADHTAAFTLPPGTHFVRLQLDNDTPATDLRLAIHHLAVEGAEVVNEHTDALALAAADTYLEHYRQGPITLALPPETAGQEAHITLVRNEMLFGAIAPGASNVLLDPDAAPGSEPALYQEALRTHFNVTVPSNAGKWAYNEPAPGMVTMDYPDTILKFARDHDMAARMHALVWDTEQQPGWVHELLDRAKAGDADAKQQLRDAISRRIDYYVADRAQGYQALDVLNESFHQPGYLDVFGVEGIADIFRETADAVQRANADTRLYVNEYNILQWSRKPPYDEEQTEADPFANWFREHVETLRHHGGPVTGIGVQYYANADPDADDPHSPAQIAQVLHNLAVTGLPISLTEFGVSRGATPDQAAAVLTDTMRLVLGHPDGELFLMFGFYRGATWARAAEACLFDESWNLTEPGRRFKQLTDAWHTELIAPVGPDGTVRFDGFYGLYDVAVNGQTYRFDARRRR